MLFRSYHCLRPVYQPGHPQGHGQDAAGIQTGISTVSDIATSLQDGTLSIGDSIIIAGEKLKVDQNDLEQGVFFRTEDGTEYKTDRRFLLNTPKQLIVRVPAQLPAGQVQLIHSVCHGKWVQMEEAPGKVRKLAYNLHAHESKIGRAHV